MKTVTMGLLAASVLLGSAQSSGAQSAGEMIARHLTAVGGRAPLEKVTSRAGESGSMAEAPQVEDGAQRGRRPLDARDVLPFILVGMFLIPIPVIAIAALWFRHRSRVKALDVLRVYAERNEEPPASVTQALSPPIPQAPPKPPPTRGHHLAHLAANVVFVLGAIGIVWWKAPDPSNPGRFVIFAILAGLFFAAGAAARLVGAIYARE